jgi:hypothetical protein
MSGESEWLIVTKLIAPSDMTRTQILEELDWRLKGCGVSVSLRPKDVTLVRRNKGQKPR